MQINHSNVVNDVNILAFWCFNAAMITAWFSLYVLQIYAVVGIDYILLETPQCVMDAPLGQLGYAFVNLTYWVSSAVLAMLIWSAWFAGNAYILRYPLYDLCKYISEKYFHAGDL